MVYKKNSPENKAKGSRAEQKFYSRFKTKIARKATEDEDIHEHWDYILRGAERKEKKVDVKSSNINGQILRVELVNRMGKHGWLYGESDYIAYDTEGPEFLFIKTKALQELAEKIKDSYAGWNTPYKKWKQPNTQAVVGFVLLEDLEEKDVIRL